ncbi:MAG: ribosomal protein S18-alanine N-acetyltransferase [Terracidiphilus sp.]
MKAKIVKTGIEIRPMAATDLAQVQAIAEGFPEAPHWPQSAYLNALNSQIDPESTPRRIALVATDPQSGPVRGFAVANLLPPEAELETIAVAPASQRQGIGQFLFHALAAELQAAGTREILLEVRASNRPALTLYRLLGFTQIGMRPGYYADPIEDAVLMHLPLG